MDKGAYTAQDEFTQLNYKTNQKVLYMLSITSAPGSGKLKRHTDITDGDHHPGSGGALESSSEDSNGQPNRRRMRRVDAGYCYEQLGEERHGGRW